MAEQVRSSASRQTREKVNLAFAFVFAKEAEQNEKRAQEVSHDEEVVRESRLSGVSAQVSFSR